ncbi:MAG: hypothetical protein H6706_24655 [Myxococcales bacterium]|nr:hypothetical protein [Myxococcales bacterium]
MKAISPWLLGATAAGWLTWLWAWPLGLGVAVPLLALAGTGGRRQAALAAVLSPFVVVPAVGFVVGVSQWIGGRADLRYPGPPSVESSNLHPKYRVPVRATGTFEQGPEALYRVPRNAAIHTLGTVLGPMPGSYRGQLLSREAAWKLLDQGTEARLYGDRLMLLDSYRFAPVVGVLGDLQPYDRDLRAGFAGDTLVVGHMNQLWQVDAAGRPLGTWRRHDLVFRWPLR